MKTALAVAAALLVAGPAFAVPKPSKTAKTVKSDPTDPLKWNPETERNSPSDWLVVTIGSDKYLGHLPPKPQWGQKGYEASAKPYVVGVPLFKINGVSDGTPQPKKKDSKVAKVATEASPYRLEVADNSDTRVICPAASGCASSDDLSKAMPMPIKSEPGILGAIKSDDPNLVLQVSPPTAASTGDKAADKGAATPSDEPALGSWEQAAFESIASPSEMPKTNKEKRDKLNASLAQYVADHDGDKAAAGQMGAAELLFLKKRLGDGAAPDLKTADWQRARWRAAIVGEIKDYQQFGRSKADSFAGGSRLTDVKRDSINDAQPPSNDVEAALAKIYPENTRQAGAKRAVVAAWLNNRKDLPETKAEIEKLEKNPPTGPAAEGEWKKLWGGVTNGGYLMDALNGTDHNNALAGVERTTLLDAYCTRNMSGAHATGPTKASAMTQLKQDKKATATAATGKDNDNTGGQVSDGSSGAPAAGGLAGECAKRFAEIDGKIAALTPRAQAPTLTGPSDEVKDKLETSPAGDQAIGENKEGGADKKPWLSKKGEEVIKDSVSLGIAGSLFGFLLGGPIGMLVLGGVCAGAGAGLSYYNQTKKEKKS